MPEGMNQWLAQCYDTPGAATDEDLQKVAEVQLFAKLAAEEGLDLNAMTDTQVADLWNKIAMDHEEEENGKEKGNGKAPPFEKKEKKEEKEEEEAKESAAREWAMQKSASDQIAFMDYCGRVMAHAYVNELTKIGASMADGDEKTASAGVAALLADLPQGGAASATAAAPEDVNDRIAKLASAAPAAAAATSSSQTLDFLAAQEAVKIATEAEIDPNFVAEKLNAVLTLGPHESTKIASAETFEQAVGIRGLELLEQAGFEVTWAA